MAAVLIVDDDADLLVALSEVVDDEGWTVFAATSSAAALELARSNRVDVVPADLSLADGEGGALQKGFQALGHAGVAPFVFMTGWPLRAPKLNGSIVLMKPFDIREAVAALEHVVRRHRSSRRGPRTADRTPELDRIRRRTEVGS